MRTAERAPASTRIPVWSDPGLRFAAGQGILVGVLLITGLAGLGTTATVLVAGAAMLWVASGLPLCFRAALGLTCWTFVTGFVVNGLGVLMVSPDDLGRLLVLELVITVLPVGRHGRPGDRAH